MRAILSPFPANRSPFRTAEPVVESAALARRTRPCRPDREPARGLLARGPDRGRRRRKKRSGSAKRRSESLAIFVSTGVSSASTAKDSASRRVSGAPCGSSACAVSARSASPLLETLDLVYLPRTEGGSPAREGGERALDASDMNVSVLRWRLARSGRGGAGTAPPRAAGEAALFSGLPGAFVLRAAPTGTRRSAAPARTMRRPGGGRWVDSSSCWTPGNGPVSSRLPPSDETDRSHNDASAPSGATHAAAATTAARTTRSPRPLSRSARSASTGSGPMSSVRTAATTRGKKVLEVKELA